ncbi:MAG: 2Fe-2S iron-sulfur cluster binding domain-containing protein [Steroidobacteraceae bacterium]|nr:2Fe-2S iron-sulfur cluster binding domain-containing protein [Deltaproteobacteria bacterium]
MNKSNWPQAAAMAEALRSRHCVASESSMNRSETKTAYGRVSTASRVVLCLLVGLLWAPGLHAQSPDEHASHHPGQAGSAMPATGAMPAAGAMPAGGSPGPDGMGAPAGAEPPAAAGGMGGMGDMMKNMGATKPKDFYPTLMDLPDLPLAKRLEVEQQAGERMHSGVALMNASLEYLLHATEQQDYTAMQAGSASLREGLARFESGLAAQRALAEGKAPRNVALTWFRRDMNLLPLPGADTEHSGLSIFHWFVMVLLAGFLVAMSVMYFLKMRRTSVLLQRIADGGPVNSSIAEAADKPAVAADKPAATAEKPAEAADDKPAVAADKPATSADKPATPDDKPAVSTDKPAETADKPAAPAEKPAKAADDKPAVVAEKPATPVDKPASAAPPAGPVSSGWKGILRVNRIFEETAGVKTFRFTAMDGGPIPFTYLPGQYLCVFPMIDGNRTQHCYTISSSPTQGHYCELTIEREENGQGVSRYLHDGLQEGELLEASGPTGKFTFTGAEARSVVLIGGGVGITPLMSVIRYLTDIGWPGDIFFLYSCRHVSDFIFRPELERLCARHPKLHLVVTITEPNEEPWSGPTGHLTKELIAQSVPDIATRHIHVCGPHKMMNAVQGALLELDVPAAQVEIEAFSATQIASAEGGETPPDTAAKAPADVPGNSAPAAVAADAPPAAEAPAEGVVAVTFQKSGKSAPLPPDKSILEVSEDAAVNIPSECRVGTCGACKVKLLSGEVTMEVESALTAEEKAGGTILACQARSTAACTVDA